MNGDYPDLFPPVIPAIVNNLDLSEATSHYADSWVMVKIGDILSLPRTIAAFHENNRKVIVHQESIQGLNADRSAIRYLASIGADAVQVNKPQCVKMVKDENLVTLLGVFVLDSTAIRQVSGLIGTLEDCNLVLMPALLPDAVIKLLKSKTKCNVLAAGLCSNACEVDRLLAAGISSVITSEKSLWKEK